MDLLEQWRNVYGEAVQLAQEVEQLPEECACGDVDAHLSGRCRCCRAHGTTGAQHFRGPNCSEILDRLRADLSMLCEDFVTLAGPMKAVTLEAQCWEVRRGVFLTAADIQKIVEAFERVGEAVVGFRQSCAVAEMGSLKQRCHELRGHCEQLNAALAGGEH